MGNEYSSISRRSSRRRANTISVSRTSGSNDYIDSARARGNSYPPPGNKSPATSLRHRRESFHNSSRNSSSDKSSIFHNSEKDLPGNAHEIWDNEETIKELPVKQRRRSLKRVQKMKSEQFDYLRKFNLQLNKPVLMNLKADFHIDEAIRNKACHILKLVITKPPKVTDTATYLAKINFSELIRCSNSGQALFAHSWMGESDSVECSSESIEMSGRFYRDTGGKFDYLHFQLSLKAFPEYIVDDSFDTPSDDINENNDINIRQITFTDDDILGSFEMCDTRNSNMKAMVWKIYK